ncbi:hypothetical protein B0H19DRAFT_1248884 [Mycena capillaripes]|nr:hypothetical protein B0H19DRAFT_1248884 [Mycena capillaripes]
MSTDSGTLHLTTKSPPPYPGIDPASAFLSDEQCWKLTQVAFQAVLAGGLPATIEPLHPREWVLAGDHTAMIDLQNPEEIKVFIYKCMDSYKHLRNDYKILDRGYEQLYTDYKIIGTKYKALIADHKRLRTKYDDARAKLLTFPALVFLCACIYARTGAGVVPVVMGATGDVPQNLSL